MARTIVSCVVTENPARAMRTVQHLKKNAGCEFELWLTTQDGSLNSAVEQISPARHLQYGQNVGWAIAQNMVLDMLEREIPDFLVLMDPDLDIYSRRILRKLTTRAQQTNMLVQPRLQRGYNQKVLRTVDDMDIVDFPDPRFLVIPYPHIVDFRFDHFGPMASHDEKRLGVHMAVQKRVATARMSNLRAKHMGSGYRYLEEKQRPDLEMEARKVMGYAA